MLGKKSGQIDIFNSMIYEKLIPKDHLLVLIDKVINFSFVYEIVKDKYSEIGRKSNDPIIMFKMLLLEFLYRLSDPEVETRSKTDVAFRWFLGLNLDDEVPDETSLSHFRINRLGDEGLEDIFNEIIKECINKNLIKKRRYIVDSTDVAANVNYPSIKKLICNSFRKVIKEMSKFNSNLSKELLEKFESELQEEHDKSEHVPLEKYYAIGKKYAGIIYIKTYDRFQNDELQYNEKYVEVYSMFWDIIEKYSTPGSKDRIVSTVDPDARVAHKSPGNIKRGYKDHIIVDEDSEIILAATQTPFNVNDDKELKELVNKTKENFGLIPNEISGDKAYGTKENRDFLNGKDITCNMLFYDILEDETKRFGCKDFKISEDLNWAECPYGIISSRRTYREARDLFVFWFEDSVCSNCPLKGNCLRDTELKKNKGRVLEISTKYDVIMKDIHRNETEEGKVAINKRYIVERRFATLVRNHGLRRSRYLKLKGAKTHIILANIACNIVRMVNLLLPKTKPSFAIPKTA